ncbi:MAG: SBBP repeat-containing protein [Calditrichae bacterium]|nr:SBBP repeat-containing protein [Calditrichia bacterium]
MHPFFGEEYHDRGALILSNRVQEEWVSHYNSELLPGSASAEAVVTDADGNIYITGSITKSPFGNVCNTIKYNSFGTELWSVCYDVGIYNSASAIAVDADKNVYVTGRSYNSGSDYDFITLKYDIDGKQQWVAYYNGFENAADYATALIVDTVGNVYVTGYSQVSGMNYDYATVKYNIDGAYSNG